MMVRIFVGVDGCHCPVRSLWPGGNWVDLCASPTLAHICTHRFIFCGGGVELLIQDRWWGTCTCTPPSPPTAPLPSLSPTPTHTHAGGWCQPPSVNRNSRATNQLALFSKLQGKLECESRMKGWRADRAAERERRSFSPDYRAARLRPVDYEGLTKKKKKKVKAGRQTSLSPDVLYKLCSCWFSCEWTCALLHPLWCFFIRGRLSHSHTRTFTLPRSQSSRQRAPKQTFRTDAEGKMSILSPSVWQANINLYYWVVREQS